MAWCFPPCAARAQRTRKPPHATASATDWPQSDDRPSERLAGPVCARCSPVPLGRAPRRCGGRVPECGRAPERARHSACGRLARRPHPCSPRDVSGTTSGPGSASSASGGPCAPSAQRPAGPARQVEGHTAIAAIRALIAGLVRPPMDRVLGGIDSAHDALGRRGIGGDAWLPEHPSHTGERGARDAMFTA
jgi:hypothetical protein